MTNTDRRAFLTLALATGAAALVSGVPESAQAASSGPGIGASPLGAAPAEPAMADGNAVSRLDPTQYLIRRRRRRIVRPWRWGRRRRRRLVCFRNRRGRRVCYWRWFY